MFKKGTGYSKAGLVWLKLVLRLRKKNFTQQLLFFLSLAKTLSQCK